jgi:hypothetical protein
LLKNDLKGALDGGEKAILEMMAATHTGMTVTEFHKIVSDWIATAQHPKYNRPYTECVYQPMLELVGYLRANGFKTFIVSGGGIEFMRPWAEKAYGIPPKQVVGSSGKTKFEMRDGVPVLRDWPRSISLTTKTANPSASMSTSAAGQSPRSAIPTAICKCCNGLPRAALRAFASTFSTPTPSANMLTTARTR